MTRDEILSMEAGREMDVTVGFYVMDLHAPPELYPEYSTDISAALEVVDKFYSMNLYKYSNGKEWSVYLVTEKNGKSHDASETADTAPLAICRAALLCFMEKDE